MQDYSQSNEFLSYVYDLFEITYLEKDAEYVSTAPTTLFRRIFYAILYSKEHFDKEFPIVNKTKEDAYQKALTKEMAIRNTIPDFNTLFDFGTFIKCMEKVFFYRNDTTSSICCDSELGSTTNRKIILNFDNITIVLSLERDKIERDEYISIIVSRSYGKSMINKFIIKNREVIYNDDNDLMLMNVINKILCKAMANYFRSIIDKIYEQKIFDIPDLDTFFK